MVIAQYPHQLFTLSAVTGEPEYDGNGDAVVEDAEQTQVSECRYQPNGAGKQVTLTDGKAVVFSALIHLPLTCPDLAIGASVTVRNGDTVIGAGTVLNFFRGQLHCRAWA